jgi:hypothetical protein
VETINSTIPAPEKEYLRNLAKKLLDYARLPVMAERKRLWYLHNRLTGERPKQSEAILSTVNKGKGGRR